MFDYRKFENSLVIQMEKTLEKLLKEYDDIYIFSLSLSNDMTWTGVIANTLHNLEEQAEPDDEDYYYYKYCEEEWDLWEMDDFQDITDNLKEYDDINSGSFSDNVDYTYTDAFDVHRGKLIESCKNALVRFSHTRNQKAPGLLLSFYIREYLDAEEYIEIFQKINSKEATEEYSAHTEDFV